MFFMLYNDGKVEIDMTSVVNKLSEVNFNDSHSQQAQSFSYPEQRPIPSNTVQSNQIQNYPSSTYPSTVIPTPDAHKEFQKEIKKSIQHDLSMAAFSEIYNTPRGLCGKNKYNLEKVVFELELESCFYVKPDSLYNLAPFYRIIFKGHSPLDISEKDFNKPGTLVHAISSHCGPDFRFYSNKGKVTNGTQALLNRTAKSSPQYEIPFYYGWTLDKSGWTYSLSNNKTHGVKNLRFQNNVTVSSPCTPESSLPSAPVELTAIQQVAEMMKAFTSTTLRDTVWTVLHIAALYSLLDGLGYRFPLGICIFSEEAFVQSLFKNLLSWFNDPVIVLSESSTVFVTSSVERKDQPLLIQDISAQISNSKKIEDAVQTGHLSFNRDISYKLNALPFVLSSNDSHLSLSASFMRLEVPIHSVDSDALALIKKGKPFFEYYILHFNSFIQRNISMLQLSLEKYNTTIFQDAAASKLPLDYTTALAIMRAVNELVGLYCDSLQFNNDIDSTSNPVGKNSQDSSLISILAQTSQRNSNASIAKIFSTTATQKLQTGVFEIRSHGKDNTYDPCPPNKQGIVYIYEGDLCFSKEAFDATQEDTGYGYYTILKALKDVKALSGTLINTKSYQCKMPGYNPQTNQDNTHVYRISKDFIIVPETQEPVSAASNIKSSNECDITLHVGTSVDGKPIIWSGKNNSHICITGNTGVGKTFFLKQLIAQLPEQNARCIVFDVESDFSKRGDESPSEWRSLQFETIDWAEARIDPMPFYPIIPGETNEDIADRITDILSQLLNMGDVQGPLVKSIISPGLKDGSITCLKHLISAIYQPDIKTKSSIKLASLQSIAHENCTPFDWKLDEAGISVVKINKGINENTLSDLLEMVTSTLYFMKKHGPKNNDVPLVLVFDECMLLNWNEGSTAHKIMQKSRKDGMCAWLSSQYIPSPKEAKLWEAADLRIYFQHTSDDAKKIAKQLTGDKKLQNYYEDQIKYLERGQFIFKQKRNITISKIPDGSET